MANLIIRPSTGAGNKVIVQDQAGAAVLTTADSGATLANGLAIGTPASGTLTNCTFPAGHVLNVSYSGRIPATSLTNSGTSSSAYEVGSFQPTLSSASNKVLVHMDVHVHKGTTTGAAYVAVRLHGGGITAADESLHGSYMYNWSQYQRFQLVASTLDSNPGSTTPTYYLHQSADTGGSVNAQWDDLSFVCIEIQG